MKKKNKLILCVAMFTMLSGMMTSFAGEWKTDAKGWWWQNDDGSYPMNQWKKIDEKQYYFGADGYMLADTTTPDGYQVGADGAWISEGQTRVQDNQYLDAYTEFLRAYKIPKGNVSKPRFSLLYIDGDAIPELIISEDGSRMSQGALYHYYQGQVQKLGLFGDCGGISYIPGANIFCDSTLSTGVYYLIYYTIQDNTCIPLIRFDSYTAGNDYSINGFSVTEEMYNNQLMFWEENYPMSNIAYYENGHTLNEANIKNMLKNIQNVMPKEDK